MWHLPLIIALLDGGRRDDKLFDEMLIVSSINSKPGVDQVIVLPSWTNRA